MVTFEGIPVSHAEVLVSHIHAFVNPDRCRVQMTFAEAGCVTIQVGLRSHGRRTTGKPAERAALNALAVGAHFGSSVANALRGPVDVAEAGLVGARAVVAAEEASGVVAGEPADG